MWEEIKKVWFELYMDDVSWIVDLLRRIARDMALYSDVRCIPEDTLDSFEMSLELAYRELLYSS